MRIGKPLISRFPFLNPRSRIHEARARRCCATARALLGCSSDPSAPCRGIPGGQTQCASLISGFRDLPGSPLEGFTCENEFPDETYAADGIAVSAILLLCGWAARALLWRPFALLHAPFALPAHLRMAWPWGGFGGDGSGLRWELQGKDAPGAVRRCVSAFFALGGFSKRDAHSSRAAAAPQQHL